MFAGACVLQSDVFTKQRNMMFMCYIFFLRYAGHLKEHVHIIKRNVYRGFQVQNDRISLLGCGKYGIHKMARLVVLNMSTVYVTISHSVLGWFSQKGLGEIFSQVETGEDCWRIHCNMYLTNSIKLILLVVSIVFFVHGRYGPGVSTTTGPKCQGLAKRHRNWGDGRDMKRRTGANWITQL